MFRKLLKLLSQKAAITVLSFLLQIAIIVVMILFATAFYWWIWLVLLFFGGIVCLYIISRDINPSYKLSWCVLILVFPAFGCLIYLFIGRQHTPRRVRKRLGRAADVSQVLLNMTNADLLGRRGLLNPTDTTCADLVLNAGSYPVYGGTATKYYPLGDDMFPDMIADIRAAQKFVFMEYFIIEHGKVWDEIEAALIERAQAGVDVKLMYDDVGSMFTLPKKGIKRLRAGGVQVLPFNKITLSFDMRLNNRSHRKITVIDGNIAYTGGNNIADEYANKTVRFGHWKDTHMRFTGDGVWSFTVMFLSFWSITNKVRLDYYKYLMPLSSDPQAVGYVQPLSSGPGRDDHLIESAFINLISTAKKYVYVTTPYLILDNEIQTALVNAALAGVDVRIIIPKIPDKKIVYQTTKSFVPVLVKAGVKVFKYTPGFIHAKMVIVDDERAFIGTCNMDYRSFYLHYEDGALLYNVDSIADMKKDFIDTQNKSRQMQHDEVMDVTIITKLWRSILRLIAPMM
ncbi:MAG: cardiolipin synthase [Clostridiales bacterium]|nr:cardiolipin synthase [Clostridiales bacterium]